MPEDLLLELETAAPLAVDVEGLEKQGPALEQLWGVYVHQVRSAVERMKKTAFVFENIWRQVVLDVAKGHTAEVQVIRPKFTSAFERCLSALQRVHALVGRIRESHGEQAIPDADVLLREIAGMERLKADVFDRWQTAEDLEDLAARDYPLTTADLDQTGPQRRPPATWYAEESKPF